MITGGSLAVVSIVVSLRCGGGAAVRLSGHGTAELARRHGGGGGQRRGGCHSTWIYLSGRNFKERAIS
jgi:hypothetical protein